jgi:alpha/beta superfamily hydrolase
MRPFRPPAPEQTAIAGPVGTLEAIVEIPEERDPLHAAVVCHPHPLHGGTMRNKVVHMLARSLQMLGLPTVRFNYRGVGGSGGAYDYGSGETDDAAAVIDWMRERWPATRIWVGGFSFGAAVALRVATRGTVERLITVAPPIDWLDPGEFSIPACPWLVIHGSNDELFALHAVEQWVGALAPRPSLAVIDAADHFFHGKLIELRDAVHAWVDGDR